MKIAFSLIFLKVLIYRDLTRLEIFIMLLVAKSGYMDINSCAVTYYQY